jgi:hypothetical protein
LHIFHFSKWYNKDEKDSDIGFLEIGRFLTI